MIESGLRVGIDIGGTKTDAVTIAPNGAIGERVRRPTAFGPGGVLDTAAEAVVELARLSGIGVTGFSSIGIGVPGTVDVETGRVSHAVNLGLDGLELGRELGARLERRVRVENDVNAAALGAFHALQLGPSSSMAYLNLGTGLAAGLVVGGELWRGSRGTAGEIGHIPIDPNGPQCSCGQRGCLETVASGSAVARQWPHGGDRPVSALFEAVALGNPEALAVKDSLIESIASAVRLLVLTMDVELVVIGGGLSSLGDQLLVEVRAVFDRWSADSAFLASLALSTRVALVSREVPVAALGAALVGAAATDAGSNGVGATASRSTDASAAPVEAL